MDWKLVIGFASATVSGVLIHIAKDHFAACRDLARKRKALWLACANESSASDEVFSEIEWTRQQIEAHTGVGSSPTLTTVSAALATSLVDLDSDNIEVYQALITSADLYRHRGALAHAELERFTQLAKEERQQAVGMLVGELLGLGDALIRLERARLAVLRVLKPSVKDDGKAGSTIAALEKTLKDLQNRRDLWASDYARRIGRTADDLRLRKSP